MARDDTLEQRIESTLYTCGVHNSGEVASIIMEHVRECVQPLVDDVETRIDVLGGYDERFNVRKMLNAVKDDLK